MALPVTSVASSAADFVYYESFLGPRFLQFTSYWFDVKGGAAAGQDGMVVASAKNTLWDAAVLYLLARRVVFQKPQPGTALHALFHASVDDPGLLAEFDQLLLANPETHEETVAFAHACLDFVEARLGLRPWHEFYGSLTTPELYRRYHQRLLALGWLAEDLGLPIPRSVESLQEGIRIRTEVERRVAEQEPVA
ncbi:MAG TPA: hypothetical protein VFS30_17670 [Dehalococcoidia bacterium]|nr:hypothetical protein [Dehalococcoidia bacterium]